MDKQKIKKNKCDLAAVYTVLSDKVKIQSDVRSSEDAVWLASAVQANEGDSLLDCGAGNGVVGLCTLTRLQLQTFSLTAVDVDPLRIAEAQINFRAGGFPLPQIHIIQADILNLPQSMHMLPEQKFQHTFSNPPYHDTGKGFATENANKHLAHSTSVESTLLWLKQMLELTAEGGTLTIIHHTHFQDVLSTVLKGYPLRIVKLMTSPHKNCKRIILQIKKQRINAPKCENYTLKAYEAEIRHAVLKEGCSLWDWATPDQ